MFKMFKMFTKLLVMVLANILKRKEFQFSIKYLGTPGQNFGPAVIYSANSGITKDHGI